MKLGPLEVTWNPPERLERRVRAHLISVLDEDREVRSLIARCARSVAKDYIQDQAELVSSRNGAGGPEGPGRTGSSPAVTDRPPG